MSNNHSAGRGGPRANAGRKPGYRLRRSAADIIRDIEEKHGEGFSPLMLMADIVADSSADIGLRLDAAKALAAYTVPKPKPASIDIEAEIDLERRKAEAAAQARASVAMNAERSDPGLNGLAERLARAKARLGEES